jgi:hypothetical protein
MNTPPSNVLLLPPRPPTAINTVLFATGSLLLSLGSMGTCISVNGFPSNAPIEQIYAAISCFLMFVLAFILGLNAVMNETKRKQFKHVVERYTKVTGDQRYLPYILPIRTKLVTTLFTIAMTVPVVAYFAPSILDGMNV